MRRGIVQSALIVGSSLIGAVPMGAQGTLRGVLHDSLRTGNPIPGAVVLLLGTSRIDTTDAQGRFAFTDVRAGEHEVIAAVPWLDSLALPELAAMVTVRDGQAADLILATPSRTTVQAELCGRAFGGDTLVLLGEVRDRSRTPLAEARVRGAWLETRIVERTFERVEHARDATTDDAGRYLLCGVPAGSRLELHALDMGGASVSLAINATGVGLVRQDLTAGANDAMMVVTGRVITSEGTPVADLYVSPPNDSTSGVRTTADGRFSMRTPARSTHLWFRAIGFGPVEMLVDPPVEGSTADVGDIELKTVQELGTVSIVGEVMTRERIEFEERKKFNFQGTFFDDEELRRVPIVTPAVLASKMHRAQIDRDGLFAFEANNGRCYPKVFVDGADYSPPSDITLPRELRRKDQTDLRFWLQRAKRVEIYRDAFAPARYSDVEGCGAIVIWTK